MTAPETSAETQSVPASAGIPPRVSIIVPAYNEEARIGESVRQIEEFRKRLPFDSELIVVDDGSQDGTSEVVRRLPGARLIRNERNHGKGYAVRMGVVAARGEYVLFSDADLSAPIGELDKLLAAAEANAADVAAGSRAVNRGLIGKHQSRTREAGGILFNWFVRVLLGLKLQDTQCGFKLFRRRTILPVLERLTIDGFAFDVELLFLASRSGLKILEIPVHWNHVEGSKIRFLRDGLRMFADLVRIRWNHLTGRYS
jgi:glycosyltransferase involved in cell wall biosynthesis